jgi:hypothetical protein
VLKAQVYIKNKFMVNKHLVKELNRGTIISVSFSLHFQNVIRVSQERRGYQSISAPPTLSLVLQKVEREEENPSCAG